MTAIPFAVSSAPGIRPQEGSGRLINCFAEKTEPGARFPVIWRRTAGLLEMLDIAGETHLRGAISVSGVLVVALDEVAYAVTGGGTTFSAAELGALAGTGQITVARNNASDPDIVCVTSEGAKNLYTDAAPDDFADSDLPQPNSVSVLDGYFVFTIGDGRIFATGLNDVSVATNSYTTAQKRPGGLLRGVAFRGEFFAFGPNGCEVYRDVGSAPFPLEFVTLITRGIVGTHAVAGWEEGWAGQLLWVGDDCVVYRMDGYAPAPVSNDDVSRAIAESVRAGAGPLLEASVYMQGKHAIWRLTYPGVWTWEFNATTGNWHERQSYNRTDCRGSCTVRAFDRWVSGDRETGKLFEIDSTYYREAGDSLRFILRSGAGAAFPSRIKIPRIDIDITTAVGIAAGEDPVQTDPSILIRWSKDGGYNFSDYVTRKIGRQGVGQQRITVQRGPLTGPKGIVIEIEIADPVHVGVMGGQFAGLQRAA